MPKYSFTILGEPFCSKKTIKSRCRLIRDNYEYGQFLNESDTAFILECVNVFCPKDKSYLINNIAKIFVDKAPQKLENGYLYGGVSKRRILFFYKQSPDFHKPGLCHVQKILYL